jgi:3'(2'), 5'-bisphosphate nucleotidase
VVELRRTPEPPVVGVVRVATGPDLPAAAAALGVPPAALAPALEEPHGRLLVDDHGAAALLRREWTGEGTATAVVVRRAGLDLDHPAVLAAAAGWGCDDVADRTGAGQIAVTAPPDDAPPTKRFRHLAALAATRVEVAVALARGGPVAAKHDGSPALAADEAAHLAAAAVLGRIGVPVLSEERGDQPVAADEPWIVLDPLDGTGNFRAGLPPWAFSAALVQAGRPVAGLVVDLSSGRRWDGAAGHGARRDGVVVRPRAGRTVLVPTPPSGETVTVPSSARRVRVSGCTAVDLCLVADGSAAAWHDLDRSGTHVHDAAGGLAVLAAAGGVVLAPDGQPLELVPDTERLIRLVAAGSRETADELLRALR